MGDKKCLEDIHRVVMLAMRLRYSYPSTVVDSGDAAVSTVIQVPVPMWLTLCGIHTRKPIIRIISENEHQNASRRESDGGRSWESSLARVVLGDIPGKVTLKLGALTVEEAAGEGALGSRSCWFKALR